MSAVVEPPAATGWWGKGPPPTERWPGVTIAVDDCGGRYRFDQALADRVCAFFPRYGSHGKGEFAGKPFELLDYQTQLILRPLFGWVHASGDLAGRRRFQKAYIQIPKKNGKTQLIAGLGLYMLLADGEPGAEVYVAAADREQARILFDAAVAMVEASPSLKKRCVIYRNQIKRADDPTAFFQVLSSEAATKHGPNIHCLIMDELHAQPDRELFETLTRGVIARRQPLILLITTAGDDDESICYEEYDYAKRVLSGTIPDERALPVIFELSPTDDWASAEALARVNPGCGVTIRLDTLVDMAREAQNEPRKRNDFLRFHGNLWTNQSTAWIPIEWWDACNEPIPSDDDLRQLPCAAGLDMAQKIDLACLNVTFRRRLKAAAAVEVKVEQEDGSVQKRIIELNYAVVMLPFFWIPEDTMREHERDDGLPYAEWARAGLVFPTEGPVIDYTRIYQDIVTKILPRFPRLKQGGIGYDPAFATDIALQLRDRGGFAVEEILQNYRYMSEPCQIAEALIKGRRVIHGGHRVLRNHVENTALKTDDAGRMRPVRPKRASKHIDGMVAGLMGIRKLAALPDQPKSGISMYFMGGTRGPAPKSS